MCCVDEFEILGMEGPVNDQVAVANNNKLDTIVV